MLKITLLALFGSFFPEKELQLTDKVYEPEIKTARLHPAGDDDLVKMRPAVTTLGGQLLELEFDDLRPDPDAYFAKIIACNRAWEQSDLRDLDFLSEYNEFNLTRYEYSSGTNIPYVHYTFTIPHVKIGGNYVIMIYRDGDKSDVILTKRFMVNANTALVAPVAPLGTNTINTTNHLINFTFNYPNLDIPDPLASVYVVIRQNQRWDNAQQDIKPSFVRPGQLEYRFMNSNHAFQAGNEFRFFDFRSVNAPGQNTAGIKRDGDEIDLVVALDEPRDWQPHTQIQDLNGAYVIDNLHARPGETTGNYVNVRFQLKASQLKEDIFVMGLYTDYNKTDDNRMLFKNGLYTSTQLLKQGFYSYTYVVDGAKPNQLEGDFFQTENNYEILVYHRPYFPEHDVLVAYYAFNVNGR